MSNEISPLQRVGGFGAVPFWLAFLGLVIIIVPDYSDFGLIAGGMMVWVSLRMR